MGSAVTAVAPCSIDPELWMSDLRTDQRKAAQKCRVLCPISQFNGCRDEGWCHEFGVWGGMTPGDRRKEDAERYEAGLSKRKKLSDDLDGIAVANAKALAGPTLKKAIPEWLRQEAPAPMSHAERVHMRLKGEVLVCAVDECETKATRKGWCGRHYHRWRATGSPLGKSGKP